MSEEFPTSESPSMGSRFRSAGRTFLRALAQFVLFIAVLGALGWLVVVFVPRIFRENIRPIQQNITEIADGQAQLEQTDRELAQEYEDLRQRVLALELQNDNAKQTIDDLQSQAAATNEAQSKIQSYQATQVNALAATQAASLTSLQREITRLSAALQSAEAEASAIDEQMKAVDEQIKALDERLGADTAPVAALRRELQLVRVMQLLTRGRLLIVENNLGLAEEDIRSAQTLMTTLVVQPSQENARDTVAELLDLALNNLPENPELAGEDIEIAWQLLKRGLPDELPLPSLPESLGTGTPPAEFFATPALTETLALTSTAALTPTAITTARPTRTPTP